LSLPTNFIIVASILVSFIEFLKFKHLFQSIINVNYFSTLQICLVVSLNLQLFIPIIESSLVFQLFLYINYFN